MIRQLWRALPPAAQTVLDRGITGLRWRACAAILGLHGQVRNLAWREDVQARAASQGLTNMIFVGRTLAVRDMLDASAERVAAVAD